MIDKYKEVMDSHLFSFYYLCKCILPAQYLF
jgi:hypothetical protein